MSRTLPLDRSLSWGMSELIRAKEGVIFLRYSAPGSPASVVVASHSELSEMKKEANQYSESSQSPVDSRSGQDRETGADEAISDTPPKNCRIAGSGS
jgi:hypothetical protein